MPLEQVAEERFIELMNLDAVGRHLPLLTSAFGAETYQAFIAAKQAMWRQHGYGPCAIVVDGEFAGWGGLQPEQDDADFALVLHPRFWGYGRRILERFKRQAFEELALRSFTILLPPSRLNARVVRRLGFVEEGETCVDGRPFLKFRLSYSR